MRKLLRPAPILLALCLGAAACGSSGGSDPASTAPARQAIEQLQTFGLTEAEAACVVDRIGADTVNEAADLTALSDNATYQTAAKACADAG